MNSLKIVSQYPGEAHLDSITFNSGFVLPAGSTLLAEVVTNPCQ
ncbi:MAG: hypothetical protein FD181_1482 [Prolixibacteraceae bacterium]|nr:MAG: hypothetical protein FD181_1482 [Prolixibacteraceae bacterium]